MLLQLTRISGATIWINDDHILMIEPSTAQDVGCVIHTVGRSIEVRETFVEISTMIGD